MYSKEPRASPVKSNEHKYDDMRGIIAFYDVHNVNFRKTHLVHLFADVKVKEHQTFRYFQ